MKQTLMWNLKNKVTACVFQISSGILIVDYKIVTNLLHIMDSFVFYFWTSCYVSVLKKWLLQYWQNALFFEVLISEISVMSSLHKDSPVNEPDTLFIEKGTFNTSPSPEMAHINTVFNSLTRWEVASCIKPKSSHSSNTLYGLPWLWSLLW